MRINENKMAKSKFKDVLDGSVFSTNSNLFYMRTPYHKDLSNNWGTNAVCLSTGHHCLFNAEYEVTPRPDAVLIFNDDDE